MMKKVSLILFSLLFVVGSYLSTQTFADERGDRHCVRRCHEHYQDARRRCHNLHGEARERCLREINEHLRDCLRRCQ
jgi:hypothetical protein